VRLTHADLSRSTDLLGYKPQTTVRHGLEQTVAWFTEHFGADSGR